jgi:hypothetical protein
MIWWVLVLAVLTILSYLADAGVWTLLQDIRIPLLNASLDGRQARAEARGIAVRGRPPAPTPVTVFCQILMMIFLL